MKTRYKYLPLFLFISVISVAQEKISVGTAVESRALIQESYPVDARQFLERFNTANGIDEKKIGEELKQSVLRKTSAWNFTIGSQGPYSNGWWVSNLDPNKPSSDPSYYTTPATCRAFGPHCYIFVEDSLWANGRVNQTVVDGVLNSFEYSTPISLTKGIYQTDVETFGNPPNVDGDSRIIILILNIRDGYTGTGGYVAGYFHSLNESTSSSYSNRAEIYYLDANPAALTTTNGLQKAMGTTAHEFQHMIAFNYMSNYDTFFNESWSEVAEVVCGYSLYTQSYYNGETNHYLFDWRTSDNTKVLNDYSRAAKLGLYLYEQYGAAILKGYLSNGIKGAAGIDNYLMSLPSPTDLRTTLSNWWVANYLNDKSVNSKWGYNYSNIIKVTPTTVLDPNVPSTSSAVYKLGAQYLSFTSGKNLKINFNDLASSSIKIKAVKTGPSDKAVDDVISGANYTVPDFGTKYTNVTFVIYHDNQNEPTTGPFSYSYTSSGDFQNKPTEIKYDEGDTKSALGGWQLSPSDTIAVFFDGVAGTRLDSIKVGLRNDKQITGYIYNTKNQGSRINKTISSPFILTGTFTPARDPATSLFPVPWPNMAKVDLRSQNIDAGNPFAVSFVYTGTNSNNIVVVEHTPSEYYYSLTYLNNPSSGSPGWYYLSSSSSTVGLYIIRAYVSSFTTGASEVIELMPSTFKLDQNYPNPFNPSTVISYQLPAPGNVTLKVYDMLGREVATLINEFQQAGNHHSQFSIHNLPAGRQGSQLSSGIYFYTIRSGNFIETKKMVLMK